MSALTRQDVLSEQEFLKAPPSPLLYSAYTNDVPRPSSSGVQLALFADDTALYGNRNRAPDSPSSLQRAIDELGHWFRKWRIEVNPDKSAAIQFKYGKIRSRLIVDKTLPILKCWMRTFRGNGNKYLKSTLPRSYRACRNTALSLQARLGPCSVEKNYLDVINVPYIMCIGTVMTYASPVFAHAARKHYIDYRTHRSDSSTSRIISQCSFAAVDYQPPHPTHPIRGHGTYLPIHLTLLRRLKANDVNDTHD
ncbi:Probable RNA-directed DNA polymerase from transposon BS [Eumeta japonica]|uniref:Probable RNA-directed DNA polymerase from transposon BS n=1 Tax=Eumeta variegata TaxID=151549 RepID=A0A4C1VL06_EUMVA|nr:Probable RNA-directed DNA polymerase from transposon BS [Eumeta japonica]